MDVRLSILDLDRFCTLSIGGTLLPRDESLVGEVRVPHPRIDFLHHISNPEVVGI